MVKKMVKFLLSIFFILYVSIPASAFIGMKTLLILFLIVLFFTFIFYKNVKFNLKDLLVFWFFLSFISALVFLSISRENFIFLPYAFRETLSILIIFFLSYIFYIFIKERIISINDFIKLILIVDVIYILLKLFVISLVLQDRIDLVVSIIPNLVYTNYIYFVRLNFGNDAIILFLNLSILPYINKLKYYLIIFSLITIVIITSFTKYLVITTLFALFILFLKKLRSKNLAINKIIFGMFKGIIIIFPMGYFLLNSEYPSYIYKIYLDRIKEVSSYDDKIYQIKTFSEYIFHDINSFLFGYGIGSYLIDFIKDERLPFNYEVQWFSIAYQIGVPCVIIIILFYFLIFKNLLNDVYYLTIVILWFFSSFTNPYLLITSSFSIYVILFAVIQNKIKEGKHENSNSRN